MNTLGFYTYTLPLEGEPFHELSRLIDLEDVTRGRQGNHLVDVSGRGAPIVRTTTQYTRPAHQLSPIHRELIACIQRVASEDKRARHPALSFNNALIEVYDRAYHKMNYHSDQALDLEADSYIALYSCYERPESRSLLRTLKVKNKRSGEEAAITLAHSSVVLFSLATNTEHLHKIVLDPPPRPDAPDNRWLGITLRSSKTYIQYRQDPPRLPDGSPLRLADEAQRKMFYRLRGQENQSIGFIYPDLDYTISPADLLEPKASRALDA